MNLERLPYQPEKLPFSCTQEFLKRAREEKALETPPSWHVAKTWKRNVKITVDYIEGPNTLEEVGQENGITKKERARQIIQQTIRVAHQNCSSQTQQDYPVEKLTFRKPLSSVSRERYSIARMKTIRTLRGR